MNETAVAIIEDSFDLFDDLVLNLSRRGMVPSAFAVGAEFDSAMQQGCPWSVLVLDLGLPGEDGLQMVRRLRQSHPLLGIIMLTARSTLADRVAGLNAGADVYRVKPVDMGELAVVVQTVAPRVDAKR